ncbi:MAG: RNA polymerase subunit sigma-70 [Eubacteriales bacterium]
MNKQQKDYIKRLRVEGNSYAQISAKVNLPVGSVKAYCSRNDIKPVIDDNNSLCNNCGKPLEQMNKPHRFCSDTCRLIWWGKNRDKRISNGAIHICKRCKVEYTTYDSNSKYCSHACYITDRFGKARDSHDA